MDNGNKLAEGGIVPYSEVPKVMMEADEDVVPLSQTEKLDALFEYADVISTAVINQVVDTDVPEVRGTCRRCGRDDMVMHHTDTYLCVECVKAYNNRVSYFRQNVDVVAQARAAGLSLWIQQPGETQWEYTVWCAYRDSYPGKKPSYRSVAEQLLCSSEAVKKIALRWNFQVRMQAWMKHCEDETLLQRKSEILNMNQAHVKMAQTLRTKLEKAIEVLEPSTMKPSEISSMMKVMADLERKALGDSEAQEVLRNELLVDTENPNLKKHQTEQGDLNEVVQILLKAGVLGSITTVTAKETTREVTLGLEGGDNEDGIEGTD